MFKEPFSCVFVFDCHSQCVVDFIAIGKPIIVIFFQVILLEIREQILVLIPTFNPAVFMSVVDLIM